MNENTPLKIGVDFGGVLHQKEPRGKRGNKKQEMNMPGCIESLLALKQQGHQLFLISYCGPNHTHSSRRSLPLSQYFNGVYFVKHRSYKTTLCRHLGLDVLIDDRRDILDTLEKTEGLLFQSWKQVMMRLKQMKSSRFPVDDTVDISTLVHPPQTNQ
jgi:hypothetical protein